MPSNNCSGYGQTVGTACQKLPRGLDVPKAERAMQTFRKLTYLLQTEAYKAASGAREFRILEDENEKLKRELVRKEKVLAEAAALLILQKKVRALWEDEVK
jgi:hypothetical protein